MATSLSSSSQTIRLWKRISRNDNSHSKKYHVANRQHTHSLCTTDVKSIQYLLSQYSVHVTINSSGIGPVLQFFKNNKMASLILNCRLLITIRATAQPLILNSNSDCYITTVSSINLANIINYMEFLLLLTKVSCPLAPVRESSLAWALHIFKTCSHVGKSHTFLPVYNIKQIHTYNR